MDIGDTGRFDASIILNLHREGAYLTRTLLSLDDAMRVAKTAGYSIELVVVLDRPDEATLTAVKSFDLGLYSSVKMVEVENGSLGKSRKDGILASSGEYIFTADGDDLVSENFLSDTLSFAQKNGRRALYFPEYVFAFGADYHIYILKSLSEVTPLALIETHPFLSRVCAHRSVFDKVQYSDLKLSRGYAYEDWHFNTEAVAAGYDLLIVPETILFYRQRTDSLVRQSNFTSVRQIPPSSLFVPSNYLRLCSPYWDRLEDGASAPPNPQPTEIISRSSIDKFISLANLIEPEICHWRYEGVLAYYNTYASLKPGALYYYACLALRDSKYDEVFLFPFISRGGAERYLQELMDAIYTIDPLKNVLIITGEDFRGRTWTEGFPPNVTILNLPRFNASSSMEQRCVVALKIIEASCAEARIHIRHSYFGDAFLKAFAPVLHSREVVYYRFCDGQIKKNGHLITRDSPFGLIAENIDYIDAIISDNNTLVRNDGAKIGVHHEKWKCLYAPVEVGQSNQREDGSERRVMWASRLDSQKRPHIVPQIAAELARRKSGMLIDVYGQTVFNECSPSIFNDVPGLRYCGPYDGFSSLRVDRYSIFLYTSWFDGIPNVLIEAMAAGLVVIAPDVGGISELVVDGETGVLLKSVEDDAEMARRYADACARLKSDSALRGKLISGARELLESRHSRVAYRRRVAELFSLRNTVSIDG